MSPGNDDVLHALIGRWREGLDRTDFPDFCWANAAAHAALAAAFAGWTIGEQPAELHATGEHAQIQPALYFLSIQTQTPPTNRKLTGLCGMREDHFIRKFRRATGSTPAAYRRIHRLDLSAATSPEAVKRKSRRPDEVKESPGILRKKRGIIASHKLQKQVGAF